MTGSTTVREFGTRRQPVSAERVICWRLGPGVLDRCRECVYLLRLEDATAEDSSAYVVCLDPDAKPGHGFAW